MVMRLDINMTDPSKDLTGLKKGIQNACWDYLRIIAHYQLYPTVLLNNTAFRFKVGTTFIPFFNLCTPCLMASNYILSVFRAFYRIHI